MIDLISRYLQRLRAAHAANDAANELLRASADSMLDPQVLLKAVRDPGGRVVDLAYRSVNRAACLFLGREEHELVTLSQLESLSNLEGSGLWERLVQCLEVGTPLVLDDFPFHSDLFDGERRVDFRATKAGPDLIYLTWRDVTGRFQATQRLADSEQQYRLITENVVDVVFHERDGKIVWASPSVEDVLGAPPEYWIGRASRDAVPPEDRPASIGRLARVTVGETVRERLRVISVDGVTHWADTRGKPFYDAAGRLDGFIVSLHLIDDEVAAEQDSEVAQRLLRASADSMLDPQVLLQMIRDGAGRVVDCVFRGVNRATCSYLGMAEADLLGATQLEVMPNFAVSGLWDRFAQCLAERQPVVLTDFRYFSGILNAERIYDIRITWAGDDLVSVTWSDVTERCEAVQRLAASEQNYRLLAENVGDVVCHLRGDTIVWVSNSVEHVLGAPPAHWIGRKAADFVVAGDQADHRERVAQLARGGAVMERARVVAADGTQHWVHMYVKPFIDSNGNPDGALSSFRLIDDEVAAEQKIEAAQALLRASADSMLDPQLLMEAVRDPGGRVADFVIRGANIAACSYLGVDEGELLGSSADSPTPVSSSIWLKGRFAQCLEDGKPVILDDFTDLNGDVDGARRFDIRATRAGPDLISLTWSDVTGRFQAVQRLAASERQYRLLAENAADVVAHIRDSRFVWISPSCEGLLGAPPEYWIGREVVSAIPPEDASILAANTANAMAGGTVNERVRVMSTDGVTHWVHLNARPLNDDDGRQDGFTVSIRLIDDEVAAEREAQEARLARVRADERYRRSVDNAAIGISVIATDGRFLEVNDALCQFYGYDAATLLQKTWQELTAPDYLKADEEKVKAVLEGRLDSYRMVKKYIHADGHPIWGDLSVSCVRDENRHVESFVTQVADITATVEANERNRVLAQQLQQQSERLTAELNSAAAYMSSIMPRGLTGKVDVSSRYLPARALGGDCFNYAWIDDDHLLVYLIDVSGHGIEPALLSVSAHNLLRSGSISTETLLEPQAALTELNRLFQMDQQGDHYFTMWFGVYQASTRTLLYASAGAPPAFAFTSPVAGAVSVIELSTATVPVGMFEDTVFTSATYRVPPGSQILIFSDGASDLDLATGKQLSFAGFKTLATRMAASPDWSLDALIDELRELAPAGLFEDDCSLIQLTFE